MATFDLWKEYTEIDIEKEEFISEDQWVSMLHAGEYSVYDVLVLLRRFKIAVDTLEKVYQNGHCFPPMVDPVELSDIAEESLKYLGG